MKDTFIKLILNNDDEILLRTMFSLVWQQRDLHGDPEEKHPDWESVKTAYDRLCSNDANYMDLWAVLGCFCETYYLIGLKQGLDSNRKILPCFDVLSNPFASNSNDENSERD